jgi:hypothetical protein
VCIFIEFSSTRLAAYLQSIRDDTTGSCFATREIDGVMCADKWREILTGDITRCTHRPPDEFRESLRGCDPSATRIRHFAPVQRSVRGSRDLSTRGRHSVSRQHAVEYAGTAGSSGAWRAQRDALVNPVLGKMGIVTPQRAGICTAERIGERDLPNPSRKKAPPEGSDWSYSNSTRKISNLADRLH